MPSPSPLCRIVPLMFVVVLVSCGGDGGVTPDVVVTVSVSPGTVTLTSIGATAQLSATSTGGSGTTVTWSSSSASVASVSATGLVTALVNGTSTITASAGGAASSGSALVTVAQAVASVMLTPEAETVISGETLQLTATIQDAGGSAVAPDLSWTSSDEAVATVDSDGLVLGLEDGPVVITASQTGVSGTSTLEIVRGDFMPTGDGTLAGTVKVAELMIPAGVTITLTADATIDATGPMTIAGSIIGDCVALALTGGDPLTISGTVSNVCTTEPGADGAALDIVGGAVVTLDGATISSSGDVTITNTPPPTPVGPGARASAVDPALSLVGTTVRIEPAVAAAGEDVAESASGVSPARAGAFAEVVGGEGKAGQTIHVNPAGLFILGETDIVSQDGGAGGSAQGSTATGGPGGDGGAIIISSASAFREVSVRVSGTPPFVIRLALGGGGRGGQATATAAQNLVPDKAPSVTAVGGAGGNTGAFLTFVNENIYTFAETFAGLGGGATATAPDGVSATIRTQGAQIGGDATAKGGHGGFGVEKGAAPAPGGFATAVSGRGGDGTSTPGGSIDAVSGGNATAAGGKAAGGGGVFGFRPRVGDAAASGGNGGKGGDACQAVPPAFSMAGFIGVLLDPAGSNTQVFNVPAGGSSPITLASVIGPVLLPGGRGGDGGVLNADATSEDATRSTDGKASVGPGANGGDGGAGLPVGPGAAAGSTTSGMADEIATAFQPGEDGPECSIGVAQGASPITVTITESQFSSHRLMTLTGVAPWIDVAGILNEDGTVSLTGKGTMAGFPNIDVLFAGTFDEEAGTLVGDYTMDPNKVITAQHPLVYSLDLAIPPDP